MSRCLLHALAAGLVFFPGVAVGQRYRLRVDTRWQAAAYRGVTLDSIAATDTVSTPGGGPATPDGFAVQCRPGVAYCTYFRPGPVRRGGPVTTTADWTMWGFGVPGLSVRTSARLGLDLGSADVWPGTEPAVQLLEAYGEYARAQVTGRLGRQVVASRLGTTGFDGAAVVWRAAGDRPGVGRGVEVQGYLGWGLARGIALPVTSPALNPLDDFQPRHRQIVAGLGAGWSTTVADLRAEYQREVDPGTNHFVSERVGLDAVLRPFARVGVTAGADYDLAAGWWGSAEASLQYATRTVRASVGTRRYRPHFELWTIWGAFSPVPYHAVQASLAVVPHRQVEVRGRYERYAYDPADAATPLFNAEENGWRWELGGTVRPGAGWAVDGEYRREYGPGTALAGAAGTVTYAPSRRLSVTLLGSTFNRPLEFRFNEAAVRAYGIDAEVAPTARLRLGVNAHRFVEMHRRPDAGAFDWDQFRVGARITLLFANGADLDGLPPSIRLLPGGEGRPVILGVGVVLAAVSVAGLGAQQPDTGSRFDHLKHRRVFPTCVVCHQGAEDPEQELLPAATSCAACHDGTIRARVTWRPPEGERPSNLKFAHELLPIMTRETPQGTESLSCRDCHIAPGQGWMAVQPATPEQCLECHGGGTGLAHLASPDTLCSTCHLPLVRAASLRPADIAAFPTPPSHREAGFLGRGGHGALATGTAEAVAPSCTVCHARDFCLTCHVDAPEQPAIQALAPDPRARAIVVHLKAPPSHRAEAFLGQHGSAVRESAQACRTCHTRESCLACHAASQRVSVALLPAGSGRAAGAQPARRPPDSHQESFANRHGAFAATSPATCAGCHVRPDCLQCHRPSAAAGRAYHQAGFLARHPVAAYARETTCSDCHNSSSFCAACHASAGLASTRPLGSGYHDASRFFLLGHGQAARQNLESCTACHVERDCLTCHSALGGRHFNPHGPGFDANRMRRKNPEMCTACHGTAIPTR